MGQMELNGTNSSLQGPNTIVSAFWQGPAFHEMHNYVKKVCMKVTSKKYLPT
jgi:hypothetical protein